MKFLCQILWVALFASGTAVAQELVAETAVDELRSYLQQSADERGSIFDQPFANVALTKKEAESAGELLWKDRLEHLKKARAEEMKTRVLERGDKKMPFWYKVFGDAPESGRSMVISMHGGGGTAPRVNDGQWENQKRLYTLEEGVYVVPRAPTNSWNLWHQGHIDDFFQRLIENMIVFEGVNPDRVYIMGYSAGGDGVYQLAPRMADRWAGAAMMAGHPNETLPLGLRNVAFTIHMGERDKAYDRNKIASQWKDKLAALQKQDPRGYIHHVEIHPGKGHWMNRKDAVAVPWMMKYDRRTFPKRIVWKQDDRMHSRYYWLATNVDGLPPRAELTADLEGQNIKVSAPELKQLKIRLNDQMLDMDQPVTVSGKGGQLFSGKVKRTIGMLAKSLDERADYASMFSGEIEVTLATE